MGSQQCNAAGYFPSEKLPVFQIVSHVFVARLFLVRDKKIVSAKVGSVRLRVKYLRFFFFLSVKKNTFATKDARDKGYL